VSRIGRLPITVPPQVNVEIKGTHIHVKGPKGEMEHTFPTLVEFVLDGNVLEVKRNGDSAQERMLHGTARAVVNNMVTGVSTGFDRILEVNGVGYRAEMDGSTLVLHVGYSHPVRVPPPDGITFAVDTKTRQIKISGYDRQQIGQVAADIRTVRPPEPYKGKGIKYIEEKVRRKAGKTGKGK
jgi:large subunit ribosomal protein L6